MMVSLPYIAAAVGVVLGGLASDAILKNTGSANWARKLPIVSGMLLASTIILANWVPVSNNTLVIAVMSIAFFGQGMTNLGWTVVSDIAPKKLIGLTGGLFNFTTNLAGIITPVVVGAMYQRTGSFVVPLAYIAVVAGIGALAYSVVIGDIHRLEIEAE
jgi:ACS family D-galactonate transporter-like MFS transporter